MERLKRFLIRIVASERGQDMVEYALMTTVVSAAIVLAALNVLSPVFGSWSSGLASCVTEPGSCPL